MKQLRFSLLLQVSLTLCAAAEPVDFSKAIHPIFVSRCVSCHNTDSPQAGLTLGTRESMIKGGVHGPAVIPGDSARSLIVKRILGEGGARMPMGGKPLAADEIDLIRRWIDEGAIVNVAPVQAPATFSLALRPPKGGGIDRLLSTYYKKHGVPESSRISDAGYARRAYLDIWGLLPNPEQVDRFLKDTRPDKRARLVDELLADNEAYAGHWITFWNDLLHNDEGVIFYGDRASITKWLLEALKTNLPYDRFAQALIAPEGPSAPEGFVRGVTWRGVVNASQLPPMQAAQNSAQVFLGINLKCNSCHDSFISHWKLKDAYGLASFFSEKPLELVRCDMNMGVMSEPNFLFPQLGTVDKNAPLAERRRAAARMFTGEQNGLFSRTIVNRFWKTLFGRGLVEPADDMEGPSWHPELLDWLAQDLIDHNYDLKHLLKTIMVSDAYARASVPAGNMRDPKYVFRGPWPRRMTAEQFVDSVSSVTGEWRVRVEDKPVPGTYARAWRFKANALTRALGRPMRDAAVTERLTEATSLQALEMTNGEILTGLLRDGAKRMLNEQRPAPASLWDSGLLRSRAMAKAKVDIRGRKELRLLVVDVDSYDTARVKAAWFRAKLKGPGGTVKLAQLVDASKFQVGQLRPPPKLPKKKANPAQEVPPDKEKPPKRRKPEVAVTAKLPYEIVIPLPPGRFDTFEGDIMVEETSVNSEIMPIYRAFIFDREPDRERLITAQGSTPLPRVPAETDAAALVRRIYRQALFRDPLPAEMETALKLVAPSRKVDREGLQDFLWAVFLSPEFQFVL